MDTECNFLDTEGINSQILLTVACNTPYPSHLHVLFYMTALEYYLILNVLCDHIQCKSSSSQIAANNHLIYISVIDAMLHQALLQLPLFLLSSYKSYQERYFFKQQFLLSDVSLSPFFSWQSIWAKNPTV